MSNLFIDAKHFFKKLWYKVKYMNCTSKVEGQLKYTMSDKDIESYKEIILMLCSKGIDPIVIAQMIIKSHNLNLLCKKFNDELSDDEKSYALSMFDKSCTIDEMEKWIIDRRLGRKAIVTHIQNLK